MGGKKLPALTVRMEPALHAEVVALAQKERRSESNMVAVLVSEALERRRATHRASVQLGPAKENVR